MSIKEQLFVDLLEKSKSTIYTVCYLFSNDRDEVQDLFQEILIRLWNGFDSFEKRSDWNTWVYRVAMNTALNEEKRKTRRPITLPITLEINPYDETAASDGQITELHRRIRSLELFERALVMLWLEDLSYDEIAAIVGISPQNVGVRLMRIKKKLIKMSNTQNL